MSVRTLSKNVTPSEREQHVLPLSIVSRQKFTLDLGSNIQVTIKDTLIPVHHQPLMSAETPTTNVKLVSSC